MDLNTEFLKGIKLFNLGKYHECHDLIEEIWRKTESRNDKKFYQGIIQVAVALHLTEEKRYDGAKKVYERAKSNLENMNQAFYGIDQSKLLSDAKEYIDTKGKSKKPKANCNGL